MKIYIPIDNHIANCHSSALGIISQGICYHNIPTLQDSRFFKYAGKAKHNPIHDAKRYMESRMMEHLNPENLLSIRNALKLSSFLESTNHFTK